MAYKPVVLNQIKSGVSGKAWCHMDGGPRFYTALDAVGISVRSVSDSSMTLGMYSSPTISPWVFIIGGCGFATSCSRSAFSSFFCSSSSILVHPSRPRHFGKPEQLSHGPLVDRLMFSGLSHFEHVRSIIKGGGWGSFTVCFLGSMFTIPLQDG